MEKNWPIKLMMVIFRFSKAFEYRIYLGVGPYVILGCGIGLYVIYKTRSSRHKKLFFNFFRSIHMKVTSKVTSDK